MISAFAHIPTNLAAFWLACPQIIYINNISTIVTHGMLTNPFTQAINLFCYKILIGHYCFIELSPLRKYLIGGKLYVQWRIILLLTPPNSISPDNETVSKEHIYWNQPLLPFYSLKGSGWKSSPFRVWGKMIFNHLC